MAMSSQEKAKRAKTRARVKARAEEQKKADEIAFGGNGPVKKKKTSNA